MSNLTNEELELAYDEVCNACAIATSNSNDGGKMPCNNHRLMFMGRTYPVIHTKNFWNGELTHTDVTTSAVKYLIEALLEDFMEQDHPMKPSDYMDNIGLSVIQMTKQELEEVPEL